MAFNNVNSPHTNVSPITITITCLYSNNIIRNLSTSAAAPTKAPTRSPTRAPTKAAPVAQKVPTRAPTRKPTLSPTRKPTKSPTSRPTGRPSSRPSSRPSGRPSSKPSSRPSKKPTPKPTANQVPVINRNKLTSGQIAGILIGVLAGIATLAMLYLYVQRQAANKALLSQDEDKDADNAVINPINNVIMDNELQEDDNKL